MTDQPTAKGKAETTSASRYLQQLCKHWSHKGEAEFNQSKGTVKFESGEKVDLIADEGALYVTARVDPAGDLEGWKKVIDEHLVRVAFREGFELIWE